MSFDPSRVKLGRPTKLVRDDSRTLRLAKYLDYSKLPPAPMRCDYGGRVGRWPMFANNKVGNCSIAALFHIFMCWSAENGVALDLTDAMAIALYAKLCGYVPGDPSTDNGAILLDILKAWRKEPFYGFPLTAFVSVNPRNWEEVKLALYLLGPLYAGADLPLSGQREMARKVWRDTSDAPGGWGGHAMCVSGYRDADNCFGPRYLNFVTWDDDQRALKPWVEKYVDELYVVYSPAWFKNDVAPNGFKRAELDADLAAFA